MTGRRPLPIAFVITGLGQGGAETQLVRLVSHLNRADWEPIVITLMEQNHFEEQLAAARVPVHSLGIGRGKLSVGAFLAMIRLLRQHRPRVLVAFMYHAILLGRMAGWLAGVPAIISSVRTERTGGPVREWLLRLTDPLGTLTTTNAERVAARLRAQSIVPADRLRVVPNALPEPALPAPAEVEALRGALGIPEGTFTWVAVGRLEPAKDYPTLLRAFQTVARQLPQTRLLIAGRGESDELRHLADQLGVGDRVCFLGARKDIPVLLALADGFVLASAWEGLPNALLEAMAAGLPAVATGVGGVPELIRHGVTGLLVPPREHRALAKAMCRLMSLEPEARKALGERAQGTVAARFGLRQVIARWETLLTEVVKN